MRLVKTLIFLLISISVFAQTPSDYVQPMGYQHYSFPHQVNFGAGMVKKTHASAYVEIGPLSNAARIAMLIRGISSSELAAVSGLQEGSFFYNKTIKRFGYYNGTGLRYFADTSDLSGYVNADDFNDSLAAHWSAIQLRLKYSDTASMLSPYVRQIIAGTNVTVDNTDPQYPVVSATGGSGSVEYVKSGFGITVDSSGREYTVKVDSSTVSTKAYTDYRADLKQNYLVSGTNIKTINSTSILGSGDIVITGGAYKDTLYLVIFGQSNSGGASGATAWDTTANNDVLIYDYTSSTTKVARINQTPFRTSGYNSYASGSPNSRPDLNGSSNLAFYLAKKIATEENKVVKIVMAPGDGLSITNWYNYATPSTDRMYDSLKTRVEAATFPRVDLAIWVQGEGDAGMSESDYFRNFDSLKANLRRETWFKPSTPIVVSGLLPAASGGTAWQKDTTLRKMDYNIDPFVAYASTKDLTAWSGGENVHYSAGSLDTLGTQRVWAAWKSLPKRHIEKNNNRSEILFNVGVSSPIANGDSVYYDTKLDGKYVNVFVNGVLQYEDSITGVTKLGRLLVFHPALQTGDRVHLQYWDSTQWERKSFVSLPDSLDIDFNPKSNLSNSGGIWSPTTADGFNTHLGVATQYIPANTNVRVVFKHVAGSSGMVFGLSTNNGNTDSYSGIPYAVHIGGGTSNLYSVINGSFTAHGTVTADHYVSIGRFENVIKIQTSADKVSWSDVYSFPALTNQQLYIKLDQYSNTIAYPQILF